MRVARYSAKYSYRRCHKPWADIGEPLKRERTTEQAEIDICLSCTADECCGNCPRVSVIGTNDAAKQTRAKEQARSIAKAEEILTTTGWTYQQFADKIGMTLNGVSGWFQGTRVPLSRSRKLIDNLYTELGLENKEQEQ